MKTKLLAIVFLFLPIYLFSQNYEQQGDELFAQAQYEQAEKKYKAAIAIDGETPAIKQKQEKCVKCKSLVTKAQAAENESRHSDAAKYYSDLYAINPLAIYQSKANAMKQKVKQAELAERERQAKIEAERRAEQERQAKIEEERRAEQERKAKLEARTYWWKFQNNILCKYYDGTLTISGEGIWEDFANDNPWGKFKDSIKSVIISNNITNIADRAFRNCSVLTSVSIPNGVTQIGSGAFYACKSLKSITIPSSVRTIKASAFENCYSLTSISIPHGVKSIQRNTFYCCSNLITITLPNSVTYIGSNAFRGCKRLTSIVMSNNLIEIDEQAFQGCSSLSAVDIPNSVQRIHYYAFRGCGSLSITLPNRFKDKLYLYGKEVKYK